MLYLMDALFKGFERVFLFDVHRTLRDDRTAIVLFVGEMNGNAVTFTPDSNASRIACAPTNEGNSAG